MKMQSWLLFEKMGKILGKICQWKQWLFEFLQRNRPVSMSGGVFLHWKSEMEKTNLKGIVQALQKAEIDSQAHLCSSLTSANTAAGLGQVCLQPFNAELMQDSGHDPCLDSSTSLSVSVSLMQLYCSCPCFCLTTVSLEISLYCALLSEENVFQRCCEIKVISEEKTLFHRLCFHFCLCSIIISCQQGYRFCKNNITFSLLWGYTSGFVTFCGFLHHLLKR